MGAIKNLLGLASQDGGGNTIIWIYRPICGLAVDRYEEGTGENTPIDRRNGLLYKPYQSINAKKQTI